MRRDKWNRVDLVERLTKVEERIDLIHAEYENCRDMLKELYEQSNRNRQNKDSCNG